MDAGDVLGVAGCARASIAMCNDVWRRRPCRRRACDDGTAANSDSCSSGCDVEMSWYVRLTPNLCRRFGWVTIPVWAPSARRQHDAVDRHRDDHLGRELRSWRLLQSLDARVDCATEQRAVAQVSYV